MSWPPPSSWLPTAEEARCSPPLPSEIVAWATGSGQRLSSCWTTVGEEAKWLTKASGGWRLMMKQQQQLKMPLICMDGPLALTLYYVSVILLLLLMTPTEFDDSDLMYTNKECKQI
uniref:Uncharacterized protein n=1 Tax=Oryza rufipogon TaxID=4529 RepID=A0A0E0NXS0_ORYRU